MQLTDEILTRITAQTAAARWRAICDREGRADWLDYERTGTIAPVPVAGPRHAVDAALSELLENGLIVTRGRTRDRRIGPTPLGCRRALELAGFKMTDALRFLWRVCEAGRYADKVAGVYLEESGAVRVDSWVLDQAVLGRSWNRPADVSGDEWLDRHHEFYIEAAPAALLGWLTLSFCGHGWLIFLATELGAALVADPAILGRGVKVDREACDLWRQVYEAAGVSPRPPDVVTPTTRFFGDAPPAIPDAPKGWPKGGGR